MPESLVSKIRNVLFLFLLLYLSYEIIYIFILKKNIVESAIAYKLFSFATAHTLKIILFISIFSVTFITIDYLMVHKLKLESFPSTDSFFFFDLPSTISSENGIRVGSPTGIDAVNACIVLPDKIVYAQICKTEKSPSGQIITSYKYVPIGVRMDSGSIQFNNLSTIYYKQEFSLAGNRYYPYVIFDNPQEYTAQQLFDKLSPSKQSKVLIAQVEYRLDSIHSNTWEGKYQYFCGEQSFMENKLTLPKFSKQSTKIVLVESSKIVGISKENATLANFGANGVSAGGILIDTNFYNVSALRIVTKVAGYVDGDNILEPYANLFYELNFPTKNSK